MDEDVWATAVEAYRFLLGLRLRLQLKMIAEGKPPSNRVAMSALGAMERSRLKDSFRAIHTLQERAIHHFKTDF
jgi:CBS domain-containing protein